MSDPTGMTCQELVELITEYIEGTLPEEARGRFELHLSFCRACREYLEQMRLTVKTLGRLSEESIPSEAKCSCWKPSAIGNNPDLHPAASVKRQSHVLWVRGGAMHLMVHGEEGGVLFRPPCQVAETMADGYPKSTHRMMPIPFRYCQSM